MFKKFKRNRRDIDLILMDPYQGNDDKAEAYVKGCSILTMVLCVMAIGIVSAQIINSIIVL